MNYRQLLITAAAAMLVLSPASMAFAAGDAAYPNKPVTLIVPYGPGGPTDIAARLVAEALRQELGQPFIVENRAGGGGNVGTAYVARAPADGYTLLVAASAFTINPSLYRNAGYNPVTDFTPVATLLSSTNVFVASPASGIKTVGDLVRQAKAKPGALNYASPGTGTIPQLAMELFKYRVGIDITHVPYSSAGPAVMAVLSGTTGIGVSALPPTLSQIKAGKLIPLGVTSHERSSDLPNVPTLEQSGYKDFDLNSLQVLVGPAGLPVAIQDRLAKTVASLQGKADVEERFKAAGFSAPVEGPAILGARVKRETAMWRDLIQKTGITAD
jgi:tripartite-type tricarboxylate transporter receptor subunit TctC